jgi:hypothetical protein
MKLLGENIGEALQNFSTGGEFFGYDPKAK